MKIHSVFIQFKKCGQRGRFQQSNFYTIVVSLLCLLTAPWLVLKWALCSWDDWPFCKSGRAWTPAERCWGCDGADCTFRFVFEGLGCCCWFWALFAATGWPSRITESYDGGASPGLYWNEIKFKKELQWYNELKELQPYHVKKGINVFQHTNENEERP